MSNRARWTLAAGAAAALALVLGVVATSSDTDERSDGALPAMQLQTLEGGTISLDDYRGRPLVVNFFASWCAPCLAEMPAFEQVHQDVADQVGFLGVNLQDSVQDGQAIVDRTGVAYDVARDPNGDLFTILGGTAMPTTVLVDAEGNVVEVYSGELSGTELAAKIDDVLLR